MAASRRECISTSSFYGVPTLRNALRGALLEQSVNVDSKAHLAKARPRHTGLPCGFPKTLTGPSRTWRLCKKQDAALNFARIRRNELMTFVYQSDTGVRCFIVAHPSVYWYYDLQREQTDRCSFEIIPEHSVCKLYFDVEFDVSLNLDKNGDEMIETFICIINLWIKKEWGIIVHRDDILDLDSTTESKFSRHLIYQLPSAAFCDNYNVGNFVKMICSNLKAYINKISVVSNCYETVSAPVTEQSGGNVDIYKYFNSLNKSVLLDLLVIDHKGNKKLFCDEAVYTKNRHFRLYGSTKRSKNAPLKLSLHNHYRPKSKTTSLYLYEEAIFLDSLITYFPSNKCDLRLLAYKNNTLESLWHGSKAMESSKSVLQEGNNLKNLSLLIGSSNSSNHSPHPEIDTFITSIVSPGHIWRWFYFNSNFLMYDIKGYRYCGNIQRHHRSNGIKYIVNLNTLTYYQKCYDPECEGYRSIEKKLPPEIVFLYEDDDELNSYVASDTSTMFEPLLEVLGLEDKEMTQVLDSVEKAHAILEMATGT